MDVFTAAVWIVGLLLASSIIHGLIKRSDQRKPPRGDDEPAPPRHIHDWGPWGDPYEIITETVTTHQQVDDPDEYGETLLEPLSPPRREVVSNFRQDRSCSTCSAREARNTEARPAPGSEPTHRYYEQIAED